MEESTYLVKKNHSNLEEFYFSSCGFSQTKPNHSFGPYVREAYLIHIITNGKGYYSIGNTKYFLEKGQGFIIPPGESTYYQADDKDPWGYVWMTIGGNNVEHYLSTLGYTKQHLSFNVNNITDFKSVIFQCFSYDQDNIQNELILQKLAYQFMELLYKFSVLNNNNSETYQMNSYVLEALQIISHHFSERISVSDIAKQLAINPSYLSRLFKKDMGISVKEYIDDLRISASANFLGTTHYSITQISEMVGFSTIQAFSTAFKKNMGCSPASYRKKRIGISGDIV